MTAKTTYSEEKFEGFNRALSNHGEAAELWIHHPEVIGDTYEEIVENLNRLSDSGLVLHILPRKERSK